MPQPAPLPLEDPAKEAPRAGELYVGHIGEMNWDADAKVVDAYYRDLERRLKARARLRGFGFCAARVRS